MTLLGVRRLAAAFGLRWLAVAAVALAVAEPILACTVCMGAPDDPMTRGVSRGVWVLLGIVFFIQIAFAALFFSFWRRGRELRKFREQFRVIEGGSR